MKKTWKYSALAAAIIGCGVLAAEATPLPTPSAYEIGTVDPGSPAGPISVETGYVTELVNLYNTSASTPYSYDSHVYTLNPGSYIPASLPTIGTSPGQQGGSGGSVSTLVDLGVLGGYAYALVKWGNIDEIYYVGGLTGTITVYNDTGNGNGESHYDLFTGGPTNVPDGGTTALLLGVAFAGLATLKRKFK